MDPDDPSLQRSDGFVPDASAEKLLATLPNDERIDILRTLKSMKLKTDIRNPNAVLTALVNRQRTERRGGFVLDDKATGLLRELDDQARSNVSSYVNRVCKVVDACDIHVLLRVIIEVYTEQQQQQPPQSWSDEEFATCWVNVPGVATGYGTPPKRVVEEGDVRSTGRQGIEGCLRRDLGDRSFELDIVAQKRGGDPDPDPRMHGWYLLRGEGGLLDTFFDKASALPNLRRWCFIPRATEPWVSLWVGNLRCATGDDVQGPFDALFPTTRVIVKMQGSCSSGSSAFVRCHGLRDALHIKRHLSGHGSSAMLTPQGPSVRFASWQLQPQPQQRQHGGSTSTTNKPRDTGQRRHGVQNDDGDDQAERTRLEERVQVLSDQNRLLGGWLSDMDEEIVSSGLGRRKEAPTRRLLRSQKSKRSLLKTGGCQRPRSFSCRRSGNSSMTTSRSSKRGMHSRSETESCSVLCLRWNACRC